MAGWEGRECQGREKYGGRIKDLRRNDKEMVNNRGRDMAQEMAMWRGGGVHLSQNNRLPTSTLLRAYITHASMEVSFI